MKIQFLLKIGNRAHLQEMLSTGHIYINHSSFFKKDLAHGRYDLNEGLASKIQMRNGTLEFKSEDETEWKRFHFERGKHESRFDLKNIHIYSLYLITEDETRSQPLYELSSEMKTMGDSLLLIKNPREFINRINTSIINNNYYFQSNSVVYYDPEQSQKELSLFHKSNQYSYQKEFRFIINSQATEPIHLYLGDLTDLAELWSIDKWKGFRFIWE